MTNPQQNRLAMCLAVIRVMTKYASAWSALPKIADMVTRLTTYTDGMQQKSGVQGTPTTGIAGGKRTKRMEMMERAIAVAGDLHSLAVSNNDADLAAKTDLEISDLVHLGETVVGPRCADIHALAQENAAALVDFGTTAEDIAALKTAIDDFTARLAEPRKVIVSRKQVTDELARDEQAADSVVKKELDPSMRKFKTKNPSFFGEYSSARMIIDLGTRHEKEEPPVTGTTAPAPA